MAWPRGLLRELRTLRPLHHVTDPRPTAWLWRAAYRLLLWLIFPFLWFRLWWRGRRTPGQRDRWAERLGWCEPPRESGGIWLHAVSVGEVNTAALLVRELQRRGVSAFITLTTTTVTGRERGTALLGDAVHHVHAPYDYPSAIARFLGHVRPRLAIFVETELWPNTLDACHALDIPTLLANARLSARSARGYGRLGNFGIRVLLSLDAIACQFDATAQRFRELGVNPARLNVTGSMKFDFTPALTLGDASRATWSFADRPVWIAGSTHAGEERVVLDAHRRVLGAVPNCLLILVPRHPERAVDLSGSALRVVLRSGGIAPKLDTQVFIGDVMGELLLLYSLAQVAFVGGSLIPRGGQNPIEPAALGLPVLMGPSDFNFTEVVAALASAGALERIASNDAKAMTTAVALSDAVLRLLANPGERSRRGFAARAVVATHAGATKRVADLVETLLGKP